MELNTKSIGYSMAYACWIRLTGRIQRLPLDTLFIAWEDLQGGAAQRQDSAGGGNG